MIAGGIAIGVLSAGCVKTSLNIKPTGSYTTATYWRNQDDVITGINGIYNVLFQEEGVGHNLYAFDDAADDISVDGDHSDMWAIERFTADASAYQLHPTWSWAYEQIARSNNAIIYVPKVPTMDESIRARSLGEAYFLRAHGYWVLGQIFGEVPLIQEQNVLDGNYNIPKSSVDSVRQLIESDLLKAAALLPESYAAADKGRVTKGSAWGLLTKLYMTWEKLDKAITYGDSVINNGNYALATKYTDNFTLGNQESNTEILFAVWNKQGANNSPINIYFTPREWGGWNFHHPTQDFVDAFEANDTVRKHQTIVAVGETVPYQTQTVTISAADAVGVFAGKAGQSTNLLLSSMTTTGYFVPKYTAFNPDGTGALDGDLKQPLLRTADIYLLVAEAKIRTSGAGAGDAEINAVRTRAGLTGLTDATISDLIHERRVELGGENTRFQDLLRWDKVGVINLDTIVGKPKLSSPNAPYDGGTIVAGRTFTRPKNYYWPLPQVVIDESKGVITQNSNY